MAAWLIHLSPRQKRRLRSNLEGYLFVLPVVLGLVIWTTGPVLASLYLSLTDYSLVGSFNFIGLLNYRDLLFSDRLFWLSLRVTATYAVLAVPLGLIGGLAIALVLNLKVRGLAFFRTSFYMPSIVPTVASAVLWGWLLNPDWGLINAALRFAHAPISRWLAAPQSALPALVLMSLWGLGGSMVIYLAGLQNIPDQLYEAASIDGADVWNRFWHITIPMLSPTLFFTLVMGLIGSLQYFTQAYILTSGGPEYATEFYTLNLYQKAFEWFKMGYASAMAWILFVVILVLTLLVFRSSSLWVYYEGEGRAP